MIILSDKQKEQIYYHTLSCYPEEMCGILLEEDFIPIKNVSKTPLESFELNPEQYAPIACREKIKGIIHSHCRNPRNPEVFDTRTPSLADINGQKQTKVPWLIVASEGMTVTPPLELPRLQSNRYIGRQFIWFINDCYTLVQDYYKFELGIELPDHKAEKDFKALRHFEGLFDGFIEAYGFTDLTKGESLTNGDLFLVDNAGHRRNHLAIWHNGKVLHQDVVSLETNPAVFAGRTHRYLRYREV